MDTADIRRRFIAHFEAAEHRAAQGEGRRAQAILARLLHIVEIAQLGERVSQARYGRLGQATSLGDVLVAEQPAAAAEARQHIQAAR